MPNRVYLGLGSNIGDREANLFSAIAALELREPCTVLKTASIYETDPLVNLNQPDFLNTVVEIETPAEPETLLLECQAVELLMGRPADHEKNQPRIIDIDILAYETVQVDLPHLKIPHPEIPLRRFVLEPFNEIASDFTIPGFRMTVNELLRLCPDQSKVTLHRMEKSA